MAQRKVPPPTGARRPVGVGTRTPDAVHEHGWLQHRLQPRGDRATPPERHRQSRGDSAGVRCRRAATARVAPPTGGMIGARGGGGKEHDDSERARGGQGVATPRADARRGASVGAPAAALAVFWPTEAAAGGRAAGFTHSPAARPRGDTPRGPVLPGDSSHSMQEGSPPRLSRDVEARPAIPLQHTRRAHSLGKAGEWDPLASSSHPPPPNARRNRRGPECGWSSEPAEGFTVTRLLGVNERAMLTVPAKQAFGPGKRSCFSSNCDCGRDVDDLALAFRQGGVSTVQAYSFHTASAPEGLLAIP